MSYLQAKSDLNFIKDFHQSVVELWQIEKETAENLIYSDFRSKREYQIALQSEASKIPGYQKIRKRVAQGVLRAERIATRPDVPIILESYPAPAVGGPIIRQKAFSAILKDMSHGGLIDNQMIYDILNQTMGECEAEVSREFRHLINPFYWILELIIFIIRIPFLLVQTSGFNVSKVEDHFLAKAFKLLEVIAIIYILIRLGLEREDLQQIFLKLFK